MTNLYILSAVALSWTLVTAQDTTSSFDAAVDSNSNSQQVISPSAQNSTALTDTTLSNLKNQPKLSIDSNSVIPKTVAIDTASPQKKNTIIQEIEEDLILDGGEENIISPKAVGTTVLPAPQPSDSTVKQNPSVLADSITSGQNSLSEQQRRILSHYPTTAIPTIEQESKPLLIEKTQSINFAKNFKEYRSPKVAILLSLLVPGAGQAYSHNKLKAGIFGGVEVAFIAAGAIVGIQGNKRLKDAHSFANDHYSIDSLEDYYSKLDKYCQSKAFDIDSQIFINYIDYNTFKNEANNKSQSYYNNISNQVSPYIQGWTDVTPRFDDSFEPINATDSGRYYAIEDSAYLVYFVNNQGDTSSPQYGFSKNQKIFNDMVSKSNLYSRWSGRLFTMLLINHVVSAIDAAITAKAFNDRLLGKNTLWQKFNLRETLVSTPAGPAQGYSLEVRF